MNCSTSARNSAGSAGQLRQRLGQAVADLDVAAAQRAQQLGLVVARHAQRIAGRDHAHHQPQHAGGVRPAVDQVADEDRAPAAGVTASTGRPGSSRSSVVAERRRAGLQLGPAAVDVADDVERAGLVPQVVVAAACRTIDGARRPPRRVRSTWTVRNPSRCRPRRPRRSWSRWRRSTCARSPGRALGVALRADALGQVEHDRHRQHVVLAGQRDQLLAGIGLHVGGVDDGQPAGGQPLARRCSRSSVERVRGGGLVVLVVGDQAAAEVARRSPRSA